jgi:hypothetical protein
MAGESLRFYNNLQTFILHVIQVVSSTGRFFLISFAIWQFQEKTPVNAAQIISGFQEMASGNKKMTFGN